MAFEKGLSGNPRGRPPIADSAAEAVRKAIGDHDWAAMAVSLMNVVMDSEQKGKDRAACYNALADRAFGKPIQKQIIQEDKTPPIDEETLKQLRDAIINDPENRLENIGKG